MQNIIRVCCLAVLFVSQAAFAAEVDGKWEQLFNGKDLSGWTVKIRGHKAGVNHANTFRVEDGVMKVSYDGYEKFNETFGHIFYNGEFSHYRLRVEYRFTGEQCPGGPGWALRNSGVMVHGESPATMKVDQDFPVSIEVQLLGGAAEGKRTTGNLCTPGTHVVMGGKLFKPHCINSSSKTYRGEQWVTSEIEVRGNKLIRHLINGEEVLKYTNPQLDTGDAHARSLMKDNNPQLSSGTISLQSESHPVEFRKVEIMRLKPE